MSCMYLGLVSVLVSDVGDGDDLASWSGVSVGPFSDHRRLRRVASETLGCAALLTDDAVTCFVAGEDR